MKRGFKGAQTKQPYQTTKTTNKPRQPQTTFCLQKKQKQTPVIQMKVYICIFIEIAQTPIKSFLALENFFFIQTSFVLWSNF